MPDTAVRASRVPWSAPADTGFAAEIKQLVDELLNADLDEQQRQQSLAALDQIIARRDRPEKFLEYPELRAVYGVPYSRRWLSTLEEQGDFPRRVNLQGRTRWLRSEIEAWIAEQARTGRGPGRDFRPAARRTARKGIVT